MKTVKSILGVIALTIFATAGLSAQGFSTGADVYSSYVWRGTKAADFSIQPTVKYQTGDLTIGAWGSYAIANGSPEEVDFYASYATDFGLTVGLSDYHYNTTKLFADKAHAFEANLGYSLDKLSFSGNYIFNDGAGAIGGDTYLEAAYQFEKVKLFAGAGNGWYTSTNDFAICNIGLTTTKDLKISETLSIPMSGSVIANPEREALYFVVGFSF